MKIFHSKYFLRVYSVTDCINRHSGYLPIFDLIAKTGNIPERDMFNTFNMGVGMSIVVNSEDAETALASLKADGEDAYVIGKIVKSDEGVIIA